MIPLLLTLASLSPGDGGPVSEAARAPVAVAVKLGEGFKGFIRLPGGPLRRVEFHYGILEVSGRRGDAGFFGSSLDPDGPGRFRWKCGPEVVQGTVRRERGQIVLTLDRPTPEPDSSLWRWLVTNLEGGRAP
jgi:hypothetical protein